MNGSGERTASRALEHIGTPVAEVIPESSHFLCCGSAINLVLEDHTVPDNGHRDLIRSPNEGCEGLRYYRIHPSLPFRRAKSILFIAIMHIAPTPAQKTIRTRRHNASVNPAVLVTPKIFAMSIFPPS